MEPPPSSSSQPAAPQSTDTPPPQQPPPCSLPPSSLSSSSSSIPNPNPNPNPNAANIIPALPQQQNRPQQQQFSRPWSQSSQFAHFPPQFQASLSSAASSPSSAPIQRGGIAIGVPAAAPPAVSSQPTSFSPSFVGSQYAGIPRGNPINVPDPNVPSSASTAASIIVVALEGDLNRFGLRSEILTTVSAHLSSVILASNVCQKRLYRYGAFSKPLHEVRSAAVVVMLKPTVVGLLVEEKFYEDDLKPLHPLEENIPTNEEEFRKPQIGCRVSGEQQPAVVVRWRWAGGSGRRGVVDESSGARVAIGHGILRGSSVAPPSSSTPSASQGQPSPHQPWLSSAPHGRPPLPSQSFRPQGNSQSLQQRSHIPQQSPQPIPAASQPQQLSSSQPQQQPFPTSNQSQENPGHQLSSRASQPPANQQIARGQGIGSQRPPSPAVVQPSITQSNPTDQPGAAEPVESCDRILSKRNIQELVNQIDASEKLDPEVEDVLVDIAEDFIDSVTTFGCLLAKHRKSNTLEAKDILLHLEHVYVATERAWNMTLPGFSGDEIKTYKKPVKKSIAAGEVVNNKSSGGSASGNAKGSLAKATPNVIGS
ncbi:hypothetical protein Cgig2_001087 [Carnegiea gigantea]|uniref:Transcription initiation factor TFIID subunit 12 domain-containing protein n=1 Tax=Carnegiea gigantea TaxID=171969 RepID=A0A9Q1Q863_9CARY|nr:hypothetical protein Cgig2_001087 [Carnegiea gigantea]